MKSTRLLVTAVISLVIAGCHQNADEAYVGTWKGVKGFNSANSKLIITKNGDGFIVDEGLLKFAAVGKREGLVINTELGAEALTIDKASGHLLYAGNEFERVSK
jgi:hypothetical protein